MAEKKKRVAIIASSGSVEAAYKVLNIASAAAAMEAEAAVFFTFDGLRIIHRQGIHQLAPGAGKEDLKDRLARSGVPSIPELLDLAKSSGVRLIGCQMTMDLMGIEPSDLIDGVEIGGAATFLDYAFDAEVTLSF